MIPIPAIDLLQNEAVRLIQGDYNQKTVYSSDPGSLAREFESYGATLLHIVDLDAAKSGITANEKSIKSIRSQTKMEIELGGGIRTMDSLKMFNDLGIHRFILGTIAVEDPSLVEEALATYGVDRIVIGIDAKYGIVRTKGWENDTGLHSETFVAQMYEIGVRNIIYTDISKDGMMEGPNFRLYDTFLKRYPQVKWIASGGVSSIEDLRMLSRLGEQNLYGAVTGKAVYEGKLDLKAAFQEFSPST